MSTVCEYLVSHGQAGAFGRFVAPASAPLRRGDRVVVTSQRGTELGTVLCPVSERQERMLRQTPVGRLVRLANDADAILAERHRVLGRRLTEAARTLARNLALPVEVLDADVLLGGDQALLQCLAGAALDPTSFIAALEQQFGLTILLENLAVAPPEGEEEQGGCGKPGCGHAGGGCSTCGSDGGCSSCGHAKVDMRDYFAHLRGRMEEQQRRTSLL